MTSTLTANLTATSGSGALPSGSVTKSVTNSGIDLASITQEIGTSYEQVATPSDLAFPAYLLIVNDSATGTVSVSVTNDDTYKYASLAPGEMLLLSQCPSKPYLKGSVSCQVAIRACEA